MEIMVVVTLIGVIAAFALPAYDKSVQKADLRHRMTQAITLHAAQQIYRARNNVFFESNSRATLNTNLELELPNDGATYACTDNSTYGQVVCVVTQGTVQSFVKLEEPIGPAGPNPCCGAISSCTACP